MLRRRYPGKKFIPPPSKRICTIQPKPEFASKLDKIRQDVKKILSLEKEIAKKKRPHPWNKQPKPSTNSVLNKGFQDFEYILRPLVRPSLAFGSKIPRDPTERVIKRHKLRLRKKRFMLKPKEESKRIIDKKLVKPEPEFSFMPQKAQFECQQSDSWIGKIDETIEEDDLSEIQGLNFLFDYDTDEEVDDEENNEEEGEDVNLNFPDYGFPDYGKESTISLDEDQENATNASLASWNNSVEVKEMKINDWEKEKARRSIASIPLEKLLKMRQREASRAIPKFLETTVGPSPVSYTIPRFPEKAKRNMYAFNSSSPQQTLNATEVPSAAAYKIDKGNDICGVKLNSSLGGKQTIKLATMIRCLPPNRNICKRCLKQPVGDFYFSKYYGTLCSDCFSNESNAKTAIPHVIDSYQKARHCNFMHYHAQHNTVRTKKYKDILRSVRREAYMNLFPEITKKVKVVEAVRDDWKSKCCNLHRSKHKDAKKTIDPKICMEMWKHKESVEPESAPSIKSEDSTFQSQNDLPQMQRLSEEREYEMLVKEYAYQQMKNRLSILPIYELIHKEDEYFFPGVLEEGTNDKTDFQIKLIKRFGSEASYYGTLIPEFREKGVVHAIDPESDTYITTAKGRQFYKATPLAWELSHDQLDDDEIIKIINKPEIDEIVTKKFKKSVRHKERDIVTPPLPGPRLSALIACDTHKPPRLRSSKIEIERPIISRNYNIPKSYWYNIDR